ncbi:ethyl tert-butyl ether degradation EthD [Metarhizium anisopliae]|uniref:EthD domain-containing protein n=2 Tax=Metarhizium TaxID=5529 RepID=A0A0D9PCG7_METAN
MASITILYPSGHDFDIKYYMQTHMPLVSASWKGEGLKSWEITQFAPDQIYQIQAILKFESLAAWEAASTGKNSEAVFGDIAKFTTAEPVVVKGTHHGSENVV